jgi:hypothetical protein
MATVQPVLAHVRAAITELRTPLRDLVGQANDALHVVERLQTPYAYMSTYARSQWTPHAYAAVAR